MTQWGVTLWQIICQGHVLKDIGLIRHLTTSACSWANFNNHPMVPCPQGYWTYNTEMTVLVAQNATGVMLWQIICQGHVLKDIGLTRHLAYFSVLVS